MLDAKWPTELHDLCDSTLHISSMIDHSQKVNVLPDRLSEYRHILYSI